MSHPNNDQIYDIIEDHIEEDDFWAQAQNEERRRYYEEVEKEIFEAQEGFSKWAHPDPDSWWIDMESDFQKVMKDD